MHFRGEEGDQSFVIDALCDKSKIPIYLGTNYIWIVIMKCSRSSNGKFQLSNDSYLRLIKESIFPKYL